MTVQKNETPRQRVSGPPAANRGMTMIEIIVSLAVLAAATAVFISLYGQSLHFASTTHHRTVATQLAEAKLNDIASNPSRFFWRHDDDTAPGERFDITATLEHDPPIGNAFDAPEFTPLQGRAAERNLKIYEELTWKAYGRFPANEDETLSESLPYVEVVVSVRWLDAGREQFLAFTSSIPIRRLPQAVPDQESPAPEEK